MIFEALADYIRKDYDGLKETVALLMDGGRYRIDTSTYQNDMTTFHSRDDILSLLIHLGYLGYDDETGEVFIPNREIMDEFRTSTKSEEWIISKGCGCSDRPDQTAAVSGQTGAL